jgi:Ca2+-dependent lipid-binding protein
MVTSLLMQLNVRVCEARGLAKMDALGKSDPYAVLQLVGCADKQKTKAIQNTLNPTWNEQFRFSIYNPARQALTILLRDQDVTLDEDMAKAEIQLAQVPVGQVVDKWYDLTPVKGVKTGGQIHLVLHIGPWNGAAFVPTPLPPIGAPPYVLHIRCISAEDVVKLDTLGKSDPYVLLSSNGERFQTSVKENTVAPRWDEDFHLRVPDPRNNLVKLQLRDYDVLADDDISTCELQTGILPFGVVLDTWIELTPSQKVKQGGKLHLLLQVQTASAPPFVTR